MPFFAPPVTTEADSLFSFLEQQCAQLKITALGLSDEQARSTPTASPLSISGLLAHVAQVVNGWLQQVKDPTLYIDVDDYPRINEKLGLKGMFDGSTLPDLDIAEVIVILEKAMAEIEVARRTVEERGIDLATVVPMPDTRWMPKDFVMNVRWILAHLNAEAARHAGHADIIRESIDGAIAYQLNAQADGEPWPPEEWS